MVKFLGNINNITAARVFSSDQWNNGYWNIVYLTLSTGDPQTTIFDVKIDPYLGFMTANSQHYYLPDYFAFLYSMVHTYVGVHEALTWLIHNLIGNFPKVDAWNVDTALMNGMEKMCHTDTAIVACRSI